MKLYALPHEDGTISIMQLLADHPVEHEVSRMACLSPVILDGITEITEEEAAAIRAQRPKPEVSASSSPVPAVNVAVLEVIREENDELKQRMAALERELAEFPLRLAEMISRDRAKET